MQIFKDSFLTLFVTRRNLVELGGRVFSTYLGPGRPSVRAPFLGGLLGPVFIGQWELTGWLGARGPLGGPLGGPRCFCPTRRAWCWPGLRRAVFKPHAVPRRQPGGRRDGQPPVRRELPVHRPARVPHAGLPIRGHRAEKWQVPRLAMRRRL